MENYFKGKNVEEELERSKVPFEGITENFLWMQVKGGSKMNNLLSHASGILEDKAASVMIWTGAGVAIPKAISCAEIMKRQFSIEHQVTKLTYKKILGTKIDGLETIVVKRQIPVIHILLSVEEIQDINQLGFVELGFYVPKLQDEKVQYQSLNGKNSGKEDKQAIYIRANNHINQKNLLSLDNHK